MVSVTVICIGKLKERFFSDACDEYIKRLSRFCNFNLRELSETAINENPSQSQIEACLKKEADLIEKEIPKDSFVIALCIEGKQISSQELSKKIEEASISGKGKITFIIGSSFGLSDKIKELSDFKLSFSKMTFPHQLFRVILLEQIYRAFSITNNMKYHK